MKLKMLNTEELTVGEDDYGLGLIRGKEAEPEITGNIDEELLNDAAVFQKNSR